MVWSLSKVGGEEEGEKSLSVNKNRIHQSTAINNHDLLEFEPLHQANTFAQSFPATTTVISWVELTLSILVHSIAPHGRTRLE
jgi:hypothetical protein